MQSDSKLAVAGFRHSCTREFLEAVPVPQRTETYSPIPHADMFRWVEEAADAEGLNIHRVDFAHGRNGQRAGAYFYLEDGGFDDDEMIFMVAVLNSYDKTIRASVAVGASLFVCANGMILGDHVVRRMHRGEGAAYTVKEFIHDSVASYHRTMEEARALRRELITVGMGFAEQARTAGELFILHNLLNSWEMTTLRNEILEPSFDYGPGTDETAWQFYQHITHALKNSQPDEYIRKQKEIYRYFVDRYL